MWPDRVSNPGPLALESDALLTPPRVPRTQCINGMGKAQRYFSHIAGKFNIAFVSNANICNVNGSIMVTAWHWDLSQAISISWTIEPT